LTAIDFIKQCQDYYGTYRPYQRKMIYEYFTDEKFSATYLDRLWKHIVYTFSSEFNSVPDVAVLEKARHELRREPQPTPQIEAPPEPENVEDRSREVTGILASFKARIRVKRIVGGEG